MSIEGCSSFGNQHFRTVSNEEESCDSKAATGGGSRQSIDEAALRTLQETRLGSPYSIDSRDISRGESSVSLRTISPDKRSRLCSLTNTATSPLSAFFHGEGDEYAWEHPADDEHELEVSCRSSPSEHQADDENKVSNENAPPLVFNSKDQAINLSIIQASIAPQKQKTRAFIQQYQDSEESPRCKALCGFAQSASETSDVQAFLETARLVFSEKECSNRGFDVEAFKSFIIDFFGAAVVNCDYDPNDAIHFLRTVNELNPQHPLDNDTTIAIIAERMEGNLNRIGEQLGTGGKARVFALEGSDTVAVKIFEGRENAFEGWEEYTTMQSIDCMYLPKAHYFIEDDETFCLFLDRIHGVDAFVKYIKNEGSIQELITDANGWIHALDYLNKHQRVHGDVKPENAIRNMLIDCANTDRRGILQAASNDYLPPKDRARNDVKAHPEIDVWALGVTLYYALSKTNPFKQLSEEDTATQLEGLLEKLSSELSVTFPHSQEAERWFICNLVKKALHQEPIEEIKRYMESEGRPFVTSDN